jgi:hypothetical protein
MKFIQRFILTVMILTTVGIFSREWLYRQLVTYKSVGLRNSFSAREAKLVEYINENIDEKKILDENDIVELGLRITSKKLNFTADKNDIDPNRLVTSKTAHCVGYASFFATTCNYLFVKYGLDDIWTAKSHVGHLYILGINIHKYFDSKFFKDHDFVTIENKKTGEKYAVDPTVNDYLRIDFITYSE